jgi:group I intron endonuclease
MRISGIYKIQSLLHYERCYIGSTVNFNDRKKHHLFLLQNNKHHSRKLQNHYNKYGKTDLKFIVLLGCERDCLIENEQFFIDSHKPYFNIALKAGSCMGNIRTEEHKRKISIANKGRICSDETRKKLSEANKGRPYWGKGKVGHPAWNKGKKTGPISLERSKKLSISRKGKKRGPMSDETKKKIGLANKGHTGCTWYRHSKDVRAKIGETARLANTGRIHSDDHNKKISESGKKAWHLRKLNQLSA